MNTLLDNSSHLNRYSNTFASPEELYGPLFTEVQNEGVFIDSKTFVDCIPLSDPANILQKYATERNSKDFEIGKFVDENFSVAKEIKSDFHSIASENTQEHINRLWQVLIRLPEQQETGGSLIPLPHQYVVPGGRFREIYYWDSYFTMLGLKESGRDDLIACMVNNFAYLIDNFGFIPTANRSYYLSRSQPPFFSLMLKLYSEMEGKKVLKNYLPQLQKEYDYWMDQGTKHLEAGQCHRRVVKLEDGTLLNRYWDDKCTPRPEAFREDEELAHEAFMKYGTEPAALYRHIRAAAESGWDFSSRWFDSEIEFSSIVTTNILPIDLNCLMYNMELTLAEGYLLSENSELQLHYERRANKRKKAIRKYFWNDEIKFYQDYNFIKKSHTKSTTLAGAFPLFFKLAKNTHARCIRSYIRLNLLKSGGLLTTTVRSGQQWDAPNGWAPLQWIAYKGLQNYNFHRTADAVRSEWLAINEKGFAHRGKMLEKYNVADTNMTAEGGEYEIQEGFGWTNGVYLRMKNKRN